MSSPVRKVKFSITYEGTDITDAIAPDVVSATYTDKLDGDSPDLKLTIADPNALWIGPWFPSAADTIAATFSYADDLSSVLDCGLFEVDTVDFNTNQQGRTVNIGAQSTPVSIPVREQRDKEYEDVALQDVAKDIADRNGLTLTGEIVDVTFKRLTQNEESDLEFLNRIAGDYGHLIKIENGKLIFYSWADLNAIAPLLTLTPADITSFRHKKKLDGTYKAAQLVYEKGDDEETVDSGLIEADPPNDSEDILKITTKAEDIKQAKLKATEELRKANADEWSGTLALEGRGDLYAGVNFNLEGFGVFDGVWQIQKATHKANSGGWKTDLKVHRLSPKD